MSGSSKQSGSPGRLKRRQEFVALRKGRRVHMAAFALLAGKREVDDRAGQPPTGARFGITVTRQTGNAVVRNRIRRRLRRAILAVHAGAPAQYDFVLVARPPALNLPFADIAAQLKSSIDRATAKGANPPPANAIPAN
jgi:ribonuclease P protein component